MSYDGARCGFRFTVRLRQAAWSAALALLLALAACKKSAPPAVEQRKSDQTEPVAPVGTAGVTFNSALLEDRFTSREFMVVLPAAEAPTLRVTLTGNPPATLVLRVAVECADEEAFKELEKRADTLLGVLTESAQTSNPTAARTAEGRQDIREEIATRLQKAMEHKGIKQVYFVEFQCTPSR